VVTSSGGGERTGLRRGRDKDKEQKLKAWEGYSRCG